MPHTTPSPSAGSAAIAHRTRHTADMIADGRHLVPEHMWSAVENYYLHGYRPGSFLTAFLSNDLMEAVARADDVNMRRFHDWATFLYNYTPSGSYGSPEAVHDWLASFAATGSITTITADQVTA